jgi:D-3-phosphoglycerate dehydrogenase
MTSMNVIITDFTEPEYELEASVFAESGLDVCLTKAPPDRQSLRSLVRTADALLVQFADIDRELIAALDKCRVISRYGIGVDMIDLDAAAERRIPVANVPDFCIDEVSSQTVGFLIDLNRHTVELNSHVHAGLWGTSAPACPAPRRLAGQHLGIVGLGAIGREVARKAAALGLRVLAHDPYLTAAPDGIEMLELEELLSRSDYVSLHCPLTPGTRALIGPKQLATMKSSAYLLNLSRGPVVDQGALVDALRAGVIAGAALDVLGTEPPPPEEPLLQLPNVLITPHSSSWSVESSLQLRRDAAANVVDALSGRSPRSVVNRTQLGW